MPAAEAGPAAVPTPLPAAAGLTDCRPQEVFVAANTLYNNGGTQRANWNGKNPTLHGPIPKRLSQYFDVSAFSEPAPFTYGNSPRMLSDLRAPRFVDTDLSGIKMIPIHDRIKAEFRAEAFNILNRLNANNPTATLNSASFGKILSAADPRIMQFALKYVF